MHRKRPAKFRLSATLTLDGQHQLAEMEMKLPILLNQPMNRSEVLEMCLKYAKIYFDIAFQAQFKDQIQQMDLDIYRQTKLVDSSGVE